MIAMLIALAASATFYTSTRWTVTKNETDCSAVVAFSGGAVLDIVYDYGKQSSIFIITNPVFKSVDDDKNYSLSLEFIKGKKLDKGWGVILAKGFTSGESRGISFRLKGSVALDDVASSEILGLEHDDVVVASLYLKDSATAMAKLKECAIAINRENPGDPLVGAEQKK